MNPASIPDNLLRRMSKQDRASLGLQTSEEAQAKFTARSEKQLQEAIANLLRLRGIAFYRSRMDKAQTGTVGWPDFTMAVQGRPLAFEVKFDKGKLTKEQESCHELMHRNGWQVAVVRSVEHAKRILDVFSAEVQPCPPPS